MKPRSTIFYKDPLRRDGHLDAKRRQEDAVGAILSPAYERLTGAPLRGLPFPESEPPDCLFEWNGLTVGVEMFELEQFYDGRAFFDRMTNMVYDGFESCQAGDRFEGVAIQLVKYPIDVDTVPGIKTEWAKRGIRNGLRRAAQELVDIVLQQVPSRDALPEGEEGLHFEVASEDFPALSAIGRLVTCRRCPATDNRRTDGRAAPLVILSGAYMYGDHELVAGAAETVAKKVGDRKKWVSVDRSILVAHDMPRFHAYEGLGRKWDQRLTAVAARTEAAKAFDEFWLVTVADLQGSAVPIFRQAHP